MGIQVVAGITGDGRVDDVRRAHGAALNVVQCSGSTIHLAKMMKERYGIPFLKVSYFGLDDMAEALYSVARHFNDPEVLRKTRELVQSEMHKIYPQILEYRAALSGKSAAIYVGGAFKAISLVKALRLVGMRVVLVGSQTGNAEDYGQLQELCDPETIIVDDSNPLELSGFLQEQDVDLFIGGVKERPIASKMGVAFCDHNHERKEPLEGFEGMANFAREIYLSVTSPVWKLTPRRSRSGDAGALVNAGRA
jgi:nitrogenase molybdenum-cofactor synthesis protein NifE